MGSVVVGCVGVSAPTGKYSSKLSFFELASTFTQHHRKKFLEKLKSDCGPAMQFALRAHYYITHPSLSSIYKQSPFEGEPADRAQLGLFQGSSVVSGAYQKTKEAADVVGASVIVFETPLEFTPSKDNQERFLRFFSEIDRGGRLLVWAPRGPWDLEQMEPLAKQANVVIAYEPQLSPMSDEERPPEGEVAYLTLHGPSGRRRRYAAFELEAFLTIANQYERSFVTFSHDTAFADAVALQALSNELRTQE